MTNIQAIKTGTVINVSINGKLHKKNCNNIAVANELFKIILNAKENPTEANIKAIRMQLNERTRIAMMAGLECDVETGEVFLAGFNTNIPDTLVEVIKEYHENDYPLTAIINFWKLLMINPDKRVRDDLFNFIKKHDFVLTDTGYMLVYKAVDYKEKKNNDLAEFVTNQYLHVKKDWRCTPNKYIVYRNLDNNTLGITKDKTAYNWEMNDKNIERIGKLGILNADLDKLAEESETIYTDRYSHSMTIKLGVPVKQKRKICDADPKLDCSQGLHVGATSYVNHYASNCAAVLVCLVNPANVIAVPNEDHSKMRVCEYFPIALATYTDGKIDIVEQKYFENDYKVYEEAELEEMIAKVKNEEIPIKTAIKAEEEERPMSELMKILETRLIDLNE
jgi:hypothetical protein